MSKSKMRLVLRTRLRRRMRISYHWPKMDKKKRWIRCIINSTQYNCVTETAKQQSDGRCFEILDFQGPNIYIRHFRKGRQNKDVRQRIEFPGLGTR